MIEIEEQDALGVIHVVRSMGWTPMQCSSTTGFSMISPTIGEVLADLNGDRVTISYETAVFLAHETVFSVDEICNGFGVPCR